MLVLSRQKDEEIVIGDNIYVKVVDIRGDKVRLTIEAPSEIPVHRREVYEAIQRENLRASQLEPENVKTLKTTEDYSRYDLGFLGREIDFTRFSVGTRINVHGIEEVVVEYEPSLGFITAKDEGAVPGVSRVPIPSLTLTQYDICRDGKGSYIIPHEIRTVLQSDIEDESGSRLNNITYDQAKELRGKY